MRHIERLKSIFGCFGKTCGSTTNGQVLNELESLTRQKKGVLFEKCAVARLDMGGGGTYTINGDTPSLTNDSFTDFLKMFDSDYYFDNLRGGAQSYLVRYSYDIETSDWFAFCDGGLIESFSINKDGITLKTGKMGSTARCKVYIYWTVFKVSDE